MSLHNHILIVDDQSDNLLILEDFLGTAYALHTANTGQAALDYLAAGGRADLILLDVVMPDLDGFEVCRRLKADPLTREIPVIFLTALNSVETEEQGLTLGAEDFIYKPFSPSVVLARVRNHLKLTQNRRLLRKQNKDLERRIAERTAALQVANQQLREEINQRKQTEEALRQSEQQFRVTFEQAAVGMMHVAPDGHFLQLNRKVCELLDYSADELQRLDFQQLTHPDDLEISLARFQQILCNEIGIYTLEKRYIRKDGEPLWVRVTVSLVRNIGGEPQYAIVVVEDIHPFFIKMAEDLQQLQRTEAILRLNEARLNSLLHLSQQAFHLEEKEIIRLALEEAVRLTQSQIGYFYFINPDQQSIRLSTWSKKTLEHCNTAFDDHYPLNQAGVWADCVRLRQPVIHNDDQALPDKKDYLTGHSRLIRHMSVPVIDADSVTLIVGVGNKASDYDETDVRQLQLIANEAWTIIRRKQSMAQLHVLNNALAATASGVVITDPNGVITWVNPAFTAMTGYAVAEAVGQSIQMLRPERYNADYYQQLWDTILSGNIWRGQLTDRCKNGGVCPVEMMITPVRADDGVITHFVAIKQDITERKRAEAEREALNQQLLVASRQAGMAEIATGVLHNIGNVLNSVNVTTNLLGDRLRALRTPKLTLALRMLRDLLAPGTPVSPSDRLPRLLDYLDALAVHFEDEQQHMLQEQHALGEHLEHIKRIVSRQQAYATQGGVNEPVALARLLDDVLDMHISDYSTITFDTIYQPLPTILIDKHKLLQILVNLVRNARDALFQQDGLPGEHRQLKVRLQRDEDQPIRIEISDNGIGIAPEHQARIFEFGFTTKMHGHGFGLHTSANLAHELGGRLSCRSDGLGRGATFVLELPFTLADSP